MARTKAAVIAVKKAKEVNNNLKLQSKTKIRVEASNGQLQNKVIRVPAAIKRNVREAIDRAEKIRRIQSDERLVNDVIVYLQDRVAKKKGDEEVTRQKIDFKAMSRYANPALDTVQKNLGQYNPDTIDVTVYEQMRQDPQLAAALAMIKLPIMALPWRVECDDPDITAFCTYAIKRFWKQAIKNILTAVDFGFSAHEKIWLIENVNIQSLVITKGGGKERKRTHYSGDAAFISELKPLYPTSVSMLFDDDIFTGIEQRTSSDAISIPVRKLFVFSHDAEFGNKFGKSRLKPAYKTWYWKELLYQFMLQYYERRGSPPVIVTAPPGKSEDESGNFKDNLLIALDLGASFINNSVGVLPYDESKSGRENMWKVDYLLDDRRGEMFIDAIKHLDAKCFLALWVPETLGLREGGGSFAETTVILDLFLMAEKALVTEIESHVDQYILPQLIGFNFKPEKRVPAYFKMDQLDWNRRLHVKEIFIEMLRNIDTFVQMGIIPKLIPAFQKMAEILEIPVESWEDAVDSSSGNSGDDKDKDNNLKKKKVTVRRRSDSSREDTRKTIKPGTKPSAQQRTRSQLRPAASEE